ncbi:MAG: hypothetical protein K6C13_11565 [Oscillospiraceae bacterium]|nr:hypothetical protein [Oscillospiraceae bacterium]
MRYPDVPTKDYILLILRYTAFLLFLALVFFILYCIVYERCYNIMNAEKIIMLGFARRRDEIFLVIFGRSYKLFSM